MLRRTKINGATKVGAGHAEGFNAAAIDSPHHGAVADDLNAVERIAALGATLDAHRILGADLQLPAGTRAIDGK